MYFSRLYFIVFVVSLCCFSCNNRSKSTVVTKSLPLEDMGDYEPKQISGLPEWITEGVEGYGIILSMVQGKPKGRPVSCRVVRISGTEIKLRFLESVSVVDNIKCTQKVKKGNTYWEKEGDFWLTYEDAMKYIRKRGWDSY